VSHFDYISNTHGAKRSELCQLPGWRLERVMFDVMHGISLGVGLHATANALALLAHADGDNYREMDVNLRSLWVELKSFCSERGLICSMPRFTRKSIGFSAHGFPEHKCKAHNNKVLVAFLAHRLADEAMLMRGDVTVQRMAAMMGGLAELHKLMDNHGHFLDDNAAQEMYRAGRLFLDMYAALSAQSVRADKILFNITPKFHYMCHMLTTILAEKINPSWYHCYADEDFVGRCASVAGKVHQTTLSTRVCDRYLMQLYWMWVAGPATAGLP
jgi:hypothetical protein